MKKTMNERKLETLKAMHHIICLMNDETAYSRWIGIVPDEANEEDLRDIACDEDDTLFDDSVKLFMGLCTKYGKDGLFFQNYPNSRLYGEVR